jgi:hypothetical protein
LGLRFFTRSHFSIPYVASHSSLARDFTNFDTQPKLMLSWPMP